MYYIAFFINYPPFLYEKLKSFLEREMPNAWIHHNYEDMIFSDETDLPKEEIYPPEQWYLHGSYLNEITKEELIELPLLKGTSVEKINYLFKVFSSNFSWSIFPWGSVYSSDLLSSFVFVSRNREKLDNFITGYPNIMDIKHQHGHTIAECNLLISSYEVKINFSKTAQAILIEDDFNSLGSILWDACQLDYRSPLFVSDVYYSEDTNDFYQIKNSDTESPIYWERANYKPLRILNVNIKEKNPDILPENNQEFGVYQPQDKQSFIEMCTSLLQGTETIIVVPYDTNLDDLSELLAKIQASDYSKYSDLSYIQDILQTTEWFYGFNRNYVDIGDNMYSLFVARDNKLIHRFSELNMIDGHNKLISYF